MLTGANALSINVRASSGVKSPPVYPVKILNFVLSLCDHRSWSGSVILRWPLTTWSEHGSYVFRHLSGRGDHQGLITHEQIPIRVCLFDPDMGGG